MAFGLVGQGGSQQNNVLSPVVEEHGNSTEHGYAFLQPLVETHVEATPLSWKSDCVVQIHAQVHVRV